MKIMITGAGGYLGEHIVQAAAGAGHTVLACVRGPDGPRFPQGVDRVEGDLGDGDFVGRVLAGIDAVIFSAGRNWQPGLAADAYLRQNKSIVETFFAALARSNPAARVVFTSSMSAIAGSAEPVVFDEDSDRAAVCAARLSPYDRAKVECQRLASEAAAAGRRIVILNPGYMIGPGASGRSNVTTSFMVHWFCAGKSPAFVASGGHTYCDVRDVARAHVAALGSAARSDRYILGGENLDQAQFQRLMSEQTGIRMPFRVSAGTAATVAAAMDGLSAASFGLWKNPLLGAFVRSLPLYYWGQSARAARDLGYASRPVAQSIRDTIVDFVHRGILPERFSYVRAMTDENRMALLLLRQLARGHPHRSHLLTHLGAILATCRHNRSLSEALDTALASSSYDPRRGRILWRGAAPAAALAKLRHLLDYCYYASDEFRARVT